MLTIKFGDRLQFQTTCNKAEVNGNLLFLDNAEHPIDIKDTEFEVIPASGFRIDAVYHNCWFGEVFQAFQLTEIHWNYDSIFQSISSCAFENETAAWGYTVDIQQIMGLMFESVPILLDMAG